MLLTMPFIVIAGSISTLSFKQFVVVLAFVYELLPMVSFKQFVVVLAFVYELLPMVLMCLGCC